MITYFVLIEHSDSDDLPWQFRFFKTKEERLQATKEMIFDDHADDEEHVAEMAGYVECLEDEGILRFEGDPSIEWRIGMLDIEIDQVIKDRGINTIAAGASVYETW